MITSYGRGFDFDAFMHDMEAAFAAYRHVPVVTLVAAHGGDPFRVLVSTILSARTKDDTTLEASRRLFRAAPDAARLARLPEDEIAELVYPVGFYRHKARHLKRAALIVDRDYGGEVPADRERLMSLPGVGRKTANLVLGEAFQHPAICVDTHVHRISNRLGLLRTANPLQTEQHLERILPRRYWIRFNTCLVAHGQVVCKPVSPLCSKCRIASYCLKKGVGGHR